MLMEAIQSKIETFFPQHKHLKLVQYCTEKSVKYRYQVRVGIELCPFSELQLSISKVLN